MKKFLTSLLAGALLLPAVLSAASFEGSMRMKISSGKEKPMEIDYLIKNQRARITPQLGQKGGEMAMIMDTEKQEMVTLISEEKMYMVTSLKSAMDEAVSKQTADPKFEFTKTGQKEKILGYNCEKYLLKSSDTNMEMWLTEELGPFMGMGNAMGGGRGARGQNAQAKAWETALAGKNLFPMRLIEFDTKGKETFRMEVAAIEKKSLADSNFAAPADYQSVSEMMKGGMGGMMKGMMKGMIPGR